MVCVADGGGKSSSWSKRFDCGGLVVCGLSGGVLAEKTSGEAGVEVSSSSEGSGFLVTFVEDRRGLVNVSFSSLVDAVRSMFVGGLDDFF